MIVGLTGYAQSGKDTVGAYLVERYGFERLAFADKLKEIAWLADPPLGARVGDRTLQTFARDLSASCSPQGRLDPGQFPPPAIWDEMKKSDTVRTFLQDLGLALRTAVREDFWVALLERQIHAEMFERDFVITDVRFRNEATMLRAFGAEIFRLARPGTHPVNGHISETELDSIGAKTLPNYATLDELYLAVDEQLEETYPGIRARKR